MLRRSCRCLWLIYESITLSCNADYIAGIYREINGDILRVFQNNSIKEVYNEICFIMNTDDTKNISRMLKDIEERIQLIESSHNRAFTLIDYETLSSFHWLNTCLDHFLNNFDCNNIIHILQKSTTLRKYYVLKEKYFQFLKEQIEYLEGFFDSEYKHLNYLPPISFDEDYTNHILGFYLNLLEKETDEDGEPLYNIYLDSGTCSEIVDGESISTDFYILHSDKLNSNYEKGLYGLYCFLKRIHSLMKVVCSYPDNLFFIHIPKHEDILNALESELRQYAREKGKMEERKLKRAVRNLNSSKFFLQTSDLWDAVMEEEDYLYDLAISGRLLDNKEARFEHIGNAQREMLSANSSLLQKIKDTAIDGELFDIRSSVEKHYLLDSLNVENLNLFYELILRRNIIQREMYPKELRKKYADWEKGDIVKRTEEGVKIKKIPERTIDKDTEKLVNLNDEDNKLVDGIRRSLERLMQERIMVKRKGKEVEEPLFNLQNHWQGIYRILVDKKYSMDADFEGFDSFIRKALPKDVNKPYSKESVKQISKTDFNIPFEKWKYNGETSGKRIIYDRMYAVAKRFKEFLEEEGL